jgi:hypothetical protein
MGNNVINVQPVPETKEGSLMEHWLSFYITNAIGFFYPN